MSDPGRRPSSSPSTDHRSATPPVRRLPRHPRTGGARRRGGDHRSRPPAPIRRGPPGPRPVRPSCRPARRRRGPFGIARPAARHGAEPRPRRGWTRAPARPARPSPAAHRGWTGTRTRDPGRRWRPRPAQPGSAPLRRHRHRHRHRPPSAPPRAGATRSGGWAGTCHAAGVQAARTRRGPRPHAPHRAARRSTPRRARQPDDGKGSATGPHGRGRGGQGLPRPSRQRRPDVRPDARRWRRRAKPPRYRCGPVGRRSPPTSLLPGGAGRPRPRAGPPPRTAPVRRGRRPAAPAPCRPRTPASATYGPRRAGPHPWPARPVRRATGPPPARRGRASHDGPPRRGPRTRSSARHPWPTARTPPSPRPGASARGRRPRRRSRGRGRRWFRSGQAATTAVPQPTQAGPRRSRHRHLRKPIASTPPDLQTFWAATADHP